MTFEEWLAENYDELWCEFMESGAYFDCDYESWLERKYEMESCHG